MPMLSHALPHRSPAKPPARKVCTARRRRSALLLAVAAASCLAAAPAQAQGLGDFNATLGIPQYTVHFCCFFPFNPDIPGGVALGNGGQYQAEASGYNGASRTITAGVQASPFSMTGFVHVTADDNGGGYNRNRIGGELNMNLSARLTLQQVGQPDGGHALVKLYVAAMYMGGVGSAGGSVYGRSFGISASQPVSLQTHLLDVTVGDPLQFTANMYFGATAESGAFGGPSSADFSQAALFWLLRPVAPGYRFVDDKGNPVPNAPPESWPGLFPDVPIMPVDEKADGVFQFRTDVIGGTHYYFDPPASAGYEYQVLSGPKVISLVLPEHGDNLYRVERWTGSSWADLGVDVLAGTTFDLTPYVGAAGTDRFRVQGIEGAPGDAAVRDFVTGMAFAGSGAVELRQTALPVPEPATWALWAGGLMALAGRARRPGRQAVASGSGTAAGTRRGCSRSADR